MLALRPLLASLSLAPLAAAGQVWTVDDDPGADFTEIQPAIAAASAGDVILVKEGFYPIFNLGKGLAIVAEADEDVRIDGSWRIESIPAGEFALLRGLRTAAIDRQGLIVTECAGSVWVEDCIIHAGHQPLITEQHQTDGVDVYLSADVVIARCDITGGHGSNIGGHGYPTDGGNAVRAISSTVTVLDCTLRGGGGADAPHNEWWDGGSGGSGVQLVDSFGIVSGGEAYGGGGGWGWGCGRRRRWRRRRGG